MLRKGIDSSCWWVYFQGTKETLLEFSIRSNGINFKMLFQYTALLNNTKKNPRIENKMYLLFFIWLYNLLAQRYINLAR